MTSTSIYTNTIPYFYIIQHIKSKKLYAGSRWAKGCNPQEFMQVGGYTTSSPTINHIIDTEGLNSFDILRIDTFCDNLHVYEYESRFLKTINCASSIEWFNRHNNSGMAFGVSEFEFTSNQTLLKKWGVDHNSKIPEVKEKKIQKCLEKNGYKNISQVPEVKEKKKQTLLKKWGVDHISKIPEVKEKKIQQCLEKTGYEHVLQIPEVKEKIRKKRYENNSGKFRNTDEIEKSKQTKKEKYGDENYNNPEKSRNTRYEKNNGKYRTDEDIIKSRNTRYEKNNGNYRTDGEIIKSRQTMLEKTGYDNPSKIPEVKENKKQTNMKNFGFEYASQSPLIQNKMKSTLLAKTGFDSPSKVPFLSIIITRKTYAKNTVSKYFPEFKQYY